MKTRTKTGLRASLIGLMANLILAGFKISIGFFSGALSVLSDGINNLFDAVSSVVSLLTFHLSGRPSDSKHPFGHARAEYVGSSLIAVVILYVALQLIISGVGRILTPEAISTTPLQRILLLLSIGIKVGLYFFYTHEAKTTGSNVLIATAMDARNDVIATSAVLLSLLIQPYTALPLDGVLSVLVALFIAKGGLEILGDNFDALLGKRPDEEFIHKLSERILSYQGVLGIHDLIVHDYGPGRRFVTIHVEVDGRTSAILSHELIDRIEREIADLFDVEITIHMDPMQPMSGRMKEKHDQILALVQEVDSSYKVHDLRLVSGSKGDHIFFDVLIPWKHGVEPDRVHDLLEQKILAFFPQDELTLMVDRDMAYSLKED